MYKKMKFCFLFVIGFCSFAFSTQETIEINWDQTASLYSSNCCTYNSLSNFNGQYTYTSKCYSVYGSCVGSKKGAFWLFDLNQLPDNATIIGATFKGSTQYSDMGGETTFAVKSTTGSLTSAFANSMVNQSSWSTYFYFYGGNIQFSIPSSQIENSRSDGKLAVYMYVFNGGGVSVLNKGSNPARLSLIVDIEEPECEEDINNDGNVNVSDMVQLIESWGPCFNKSCDADFDGDNYVRVSDLLILIDNWGSCN